MKLFNKNIFLIISTIFLFLLFSNKPFGLCKELKSLQKRNLLFPNFLLKNRNEGSNQVEEEKKIMPRSIDNLEEDENEDNNIEVESPLIDSSDNENILESIRRPSSPSRRPCYFSPIQCLLHSPDHDRKFENYPEFQQNPRSFRASKLLKMDELIPKLKEEEILEEINETNSDNNNKENQLFSSLFVKVENNQNGQKISNVPNLKAALEQLLRNAHGRKLRQKTRRMLRQSNPNIILPNLNDKEIIDLANINDKTSTKREGKVGIFSTNPFIRNQHPSGKPWMRGF
uniref:Uncharacterized protein n=1 Tax=Meloidogyne enterolobii TaxID=390850 RepID=A0A6V7UY44_MELEN|nr:unnamed protein product [Meloidogyne enterolobii]